MEKEKVVSRSPSEKKLQRRRKPSRDHEYQDHIDWPQWNTLQKTSRFCLVGTRHEPPKPVDFTLRIEPDVKGYTIDAAKNVLYVYQDTSNCLVRIRRRLYDTPELNISSTLQRLVGEGIMAAVSTSNMIDRVGCDMPESLQLCEAVLADERLMYHGLSPRGQEYKKRLEHITRTNASESDYRKRREVINHMAAFCYLANKFVGEGEEFSESLLKETHRILCRDLDKVYTNDASTKAATFAGRYRKEDLFANTFKFPSHKKVRGMMRKFVRAINGTLRQAEKIEALDPFFVAAAASSHFVNIHPFLSGNGRMARMVLNAILLKYAGIAVPYGAEERDRKMYLQMAARRSHAGKGDGELAKYMIFRGNRAIKGIERSLYSSGSSDSLNATARATVTGQAPPTAEISPPRSLGKQRSHSSTEGGNTTAPTIENTPRSAMRRDSSNTSLQSADGNRTPRVTRISPPRSLNQRAVLKSAAQAADGTPPSARKYPPRAIEQHNIILADKSHAAYANGGITPRRSVERRSTSLESGNRVPIAAAG